MIFSKKGNSLQSNNNASLRGITLKYQLLRIYSLKRLKGAQLYSNTHQACSLTVSYTSFLNGTKFCPCQTKFTFAQGQDGTRAPAASSGGEHGWPCPWHPVPAGSSPSPAVPPSSAAPGCSSPRGHPAQGDPGPTAEWGARGSGAQRSRGWQGHCACTQGQGASAMGERDQDLVCKIDAELLAQSEPP